MFSRAKKNLKIINKIHEIHEIPRKIFKNRNSLPGPDHLKEAQIRVCLWLMTLECVKF